MTRIGLRRAADILAALALLLAAFVLLTVVFPSQIPAGLDDDLSSGYYPKAIITVWIASAGLWLLRSLLSAKGYDGAIEGGPPGRRSLLIILSIGAGFSLFATLGFLVAASVTIVSLAYICGERGSAPWVLALIVPPSVYFFLDLLLDVRLPTALFS